MALVKQEASRTPDVFDRFFGHWPDLLRRPVVWWPGFMEDVLRVDEYQENGTLVIRAEMAGIDPDKDVEITILDGVLHMRAERREEDKAEGKAYYRQEMRYGAFSRDVALPKGCSEEDVQATYKDGILEVRVPRAKADVKKESKKVPVTT